MIRLATNEDIVAISALLYEVHDVHVNARPDLFKRGMKKYNDDELKKIISDSSKPIFVYVDENKIEGYAFCILSENKNSVSMVEHLNLYIDDLCVASTSRRKGIGRKLFDYVIEYAKKIGCYNVTLNVWADNKNALNFYESIGLHIQKITMEKIIK